MGVAGITIDEALRDRVRGELIEIGEIADADIAAKVVEAWCYALAREGYSSITELEGSGAPGFLVLRQGSQLDHIRGVTRLAMRMGDELKAMYPDLPLDRDVLIAGGLIHDVGKPLEYADSNRERWAERPNISGAPTTRHPVHGWHVCLSVGLPEPIAHIAAAHSREGGFIQRSLECVLVHHADHSFWQALRVSGLLHDDPIGGS